MGHEFIVNSKEDVTTVLAFDVEKELSWLDGLESKFAGRKVFALRDINRANILIREEPDRHGDIVNFIDYEAILYLERGHDLGAHFASWLFDWWKPGIRSELEFPDLTTQRVHRDLSQSMAVAKSEKV